MCVCVYISWASILSAFWMWELLFISITFNVASMMYGEYFIVPFQVSMECFFGELTWLDESTWLVLYYYYYYYYDGWTWWFSVRTTIYKSESWSHLSISFIFLSVKMLIATVTSTPIFAKLLLMCGSWIQKCSHTNWMNCRMLMSVVGPTHPKP